MPCKPPSPWPTPPAAAASYTHQEWLDSVEGVAPTLYTILEVAILGEAGSRKCDLDASAADTRARRLRSMASAVAAVLKGVNLNWTWTYGNMMAYNMYALTQSDMAVKVCVSPLGLVPPLVPAVCSSGVPRSSRCVECPPARESARLVC